MVKYSDERLDTIFAALSDRTRRGILARLGSGHAISVSDLAGPFEMSLPAVMKHLDVLSDAGLIKRSKNGRIVTCALDAAPMKQATEWLERYQRFWTESFDRLAQVLENDAWTPKSNPASPLGAGSTPAPRKSSRRGRNPKN